MEDKLKQPYPKLLHKISRFGVGRGVLFRMVAGQGMIGLLLLTAILVSVWQLNTYNKARQIWMNTLARSSLISNAQQDSTVLVLVTHRVAFTQAPFRNLEPENIRYASDSIATSVVKLGFVRDNLAEEAASLPEDEPMRVRLRKAAEHMDELIKIAKATLDLGEDGNWKAAQALISETPDTSNISQFDKIHTDLLGELRRAQILTQQYFVRAQEQMIAAGRTAIAVSVIVAVTVIALGIVLSLGNIRYITGPINELSSVAKYWKARQFDVRVPATRQDEFGHLAEVFNDMAAKLGEIYASMDRQIQELTIRLDEAQLNKKFDEIIGTEYFKRIRKEGEKYRRIINNK